jgi:hypothetical protein
MNSIEGKDVLVNLLKSLNIYGSRPETAVFGKWEAYTGFDIASHSRIKEIDKGILIIEADHPGWMQKIQFLSTRILRKIKADYPALEIKAIKTILTDKSFAKQEAEKLMEKAEIDDEDIRKNLESPELVNIEDPGLKRILAKLKADIDKNSKKS